jgi:virginiamycin A acetyltransferase
MVGENAMAGKSYPNKGDLIVGNDVWIGYNATIMSGIVIGDGAIIATNATVTKDVAPYTIVGGNPAKEIRKRFDEDTIKKTISYPMVELGYCYYFKKCSSINWW